MLEKYLTQLLTMAVAYAPKVFLACVLLLVGFRVIRWVMQGLSQQLIINKVDSSLVPFLVSIVSTILRVMLLLSVASIIGIETTSFVAVLGASGLAIGLAIQGSLSNFAGGILILTLRPFKTGDFIEVGVYAGYVKEVQIFHTIIVTLDDRTVILANAILVNGAVVNHHTEGTRLIEVFFTVFYEGDIKKLKQALLTEMHQNNLVIQESERKPFVAVVGLELTGVKMVLRVWTKPPTYWDLYYEIFEIVKSTCERENITFATPIQTITLKQKA